jgi:hypothetical protein
MLYLPVACALASVAWSTRRFDSRIGQPWMRLTCLYVLEVLHQAAFISQQMRSASATKR